MKGCNVDTTEYWAEFNIQCDVIEGFAGPREEI